MTSAVSLAGTAEATELPRSSYIVSPAYDWLLLLLPPVMALGLGFLISGTWFVDGELNIAGVDNSLAGMLIGVFIHAHLVPVFLRCHGNKTIFTQFRYRSLLVPLVLYCAMLNSLWVLVCVSVLATFWDVYHSALQTFGFSRIYDRKRGNNPAVLAI
jgi:hypothetical protein